MALRQEAAKRQWLPAVIAVVLLGIAGTLAAMHYHQPTYRLPEGAYFYDLTNDQLFVAKPALPPIVGPSGDQGEGNGTAVRAYVFSCGSCANASERFVGYLENRSTDRLKAAAARAAGQGSVGRFTARNNGLEVADPADKKTWVGENTTEGKEVVRRARSKCGESKTGQPCEP